MGPFFFMFLERETTFQCGQQWQNIAVHKTMHPRTCVRACTQQDKHQFENSVNECTAVFGVPYACVVLCICSILPQLTTH
jgi:hypothetical protein